MTARRSALDDDYEQIEDDDGGVEADGDICEKCEHERSRHAGGKGACDCGRCKKFKD